MRSLVAPALALPLALLTAAGCNPSGSDDDAFTAGLADQGSEDSNEDEASSTQSTTSEAGTGESSAEAEGSSSDSSTTQTSTDSSSSDSSTTQSEDDGGLKFDTIPELDAATNCACEEIGSFDYLWVSDSAVHQLSKLDTNTMQEVARYETRADGLGSPSRTSVSVDGRAAAVANRHGGVTKVWANLEDCVDSNGVPGIQTSSGPGDILPWGEDECVAWHNPLDDWTTNRPVAWAPGHFNEQTCAWEDQAVWTAGCGGGNSFPSQSFGSSPDSTVRLLDGGTGEVLQEVVVPGYSCYAWGPYGGAVDPEGNFWFTINGVQGLVKIDAEDFTSEVFPGPPFNAYGITVDSEGRPWVRTYSTTGVARFNPDTYVWDTAETTGGQGGLAQGPDGLIWTLTTTGIVGFDPETLAVAKDYSANCATGKGLSVDGAGRIWRAGGSGAVRFNADDGTFSCFSGYTSAYTYSDMTGFGIANTAGCLPAG